MQWLVGGSKVELVLNILIVIREMEITHPASQLCCQLVITSDDIAMPTIPKQIVTILLLKKFSYFSEPYPFPKAS